MKLIKSNIANIITCIRLVSTIVLISCVTFSVGFYAFYVLSGVTDFLDGFVARKLKIDTKFGAKLDTVADILFTIVVLVKILRAFSIPKWVIIWTIVVAVIKCVNLLIGFVLHKHFMAEHTLFNKMSGIILFVIPFCMGLFSKEITMIVLVIECIMTLLAALQEGYLIFIGKEVD